MKAPLYSMDGKKLKELALPAELFEVSMKSSVIRRVIDAFLSNTRRSTADTTDKSERRGGGKKPWKQKGTGRARHGSIRSPLWRKGGVTFGPTTDRNYKQKVNKKEKRKALSMVFSKKAVDGKLIFVDTMELPQIKTKFLHSFLQKLPIKDATTLIVTSIANENLIKSQRNLPQTKAVRADQMTIYDTASYDYVLADQKSLDVWTKLYMTQSSDKK